MPHKIGTAILVAALGAACERTDESSVRPGDPIIGVLLPFTGSKAASAESYEKAMLMAVDQINRAGGIEGHNLHIVSRDSRSNPEVAVAASQELIDDVAVDLLIGPLDPEAASRSRWYTASRDVAQVLPGIMPLALQPAGFIRLAPTTERLACVLAERLVKDDIGRAVVLYQNDSLYRAMASSIVSARTTLAEVGSPSDFSVLAIEANQYSYRETIQLAASRLAQAVVLVADPIVAANVIQSWATTGLSIRWYLGPLLDNEAFLANIPHGRLDGVVGLSASPQGFWPEFTEAYRKVWLADEPAGGADLFYDAVNLSALALAARAHFARSSTATVDLAHLMKAVSEPPGVPVPWTQVGVGLDRVTAGFDVDYAGVTGPVDVGETAQKWAYSTLIGFWRVEGTSAVYEDDYKTGTNCGQ
ncbi:MAG: ABC transporter substrate-binding protein [Deltaproteobacteria bacterium]|nr:ABC transporter substrate-binding protein [Deltaproteobacteria bacterium]